MTLAHDKVYGGPLPKTNLLFEGETYDLGWDGRRSRVEVSDLALPTADFALYLVNAVKFHCSQLFHLFDEEVFMHEFGKLHASEDGRDNCSEFWFVHYLLILALGKALIVPIGREERPPGAELFVQAMMLLPATVVLTVDPLQSIEILCCTALYLQCLDKRIVSLNYVRRRLYRVWPRPLLSAVFRNSCQRHRTGRFQRDMYFPSITTENRIITGSQWKYSESVYPSAIFQ